MNMDILEYLVYPVLVIAIYVIKYFATNAKVKEMVAYWIKEAEETYAGAIDAGHTKQGYVVDHLYSMVPKYLQPVISKDNITEIVQRTFLYIENYADQQLDKVIDKMGNY